MTRARFLAASAATAFAVACSLTPPATQAGDAGVAAGGDAATPTIIWSARFGGPGEDFATAVRADPQGNIIVAGRFDGTVDFGGPTSLLEAGDDPDAFVLKLDPDGKVVWVKQIGGGFVDLTACDVDVAGNVFVTGSFTESLTLGEGSWPSNGGTDIFVAKLSADGDPIWVAPFGSSADSQTGTGIAVDDKAGALVAGTYLGTLTVGSFTLATNEDVAGPFLARLEPKNGTPTWAEDLGTDVDSGPMGSVHVARAPDQSVAVAGSCDGALSLAEAHVPCQGVYVALVDTKSGELAWSEVAETPGGLLGGVAVAPDGRVIVSGMLEAGASSLGDAAIGTAQGGSFFLAGLDPKNGEAEWDQTFPSQVGKAAPVLDRGADAVAIAGDFLGAVEGIGNGVGGGGGGAGSEVSVSGDQTAVFIAKRATDGAPIWATALYAEGPILAGDVAIDAQAKVIVAGGFTTTLQHRESKLQTAAGARDVFVVKIGP